MEPDMEPEAKRQKLTPEEDGVDDEASEDEEAVDLQARPGFFHFKAKYDPFWDYEAICNKTFRSDKPYLCVIEHLNMANTHVHFQGHADLTFGSMRQKLTKLNKTHHLRKFKNGRNISMKARAPTDVGFQYMCKEYKPEHVLAKNMFTEEDLMELKAKSTMHVKALKACIPDFIKGWNKADMQAILMGIDTTQLLIERCGKALFHCAEKGQIELPKYNKHYTRQSVIQGLLENEHLSISWKGKLYTL